MRVPCTHTCHIIISIPFFPAYGKHFFYFSAGVWKWRVLVDIFPHEGYNLRKSPGRFSVTPAYEAMLAYALDAWGTVPDHPFRDDLDTAVLRHPRTRKWFALFMTISRSKLGLGDGRIRVVNLKCSADTLATLLGSEGFHPAYHMNKSHWMTVLLDGTVPDDMLAELLMESYSLVE